MLIFILKITCKNTGYIFHKHDDGDVYLINTSGSDVFLDNNEGTLFQFESKNKKLKIYNNDMYLGVRDDYVSMVKNEILWDAEDKGTYHLLKYNGLCLTTEDDYLMVKPCINSKSQEFILGNREGNRNVHYIVTSTMVEHTTMTVINTSVDSITMTNTTFSTSTVTETDRVYVTERVKLYALDDESSSVDLEKTVRKPQHNYYVERPMRDAESSTTSSHDKHEIGNHKMEDSDRSSDSSDDGMRDGKRKRRFGGRRRFRKMVKRHRKGLDRNSDSDSNNVEGFVRKQVEKINKIGIGDFKSDFTKNRLKYGKKQKRKHGMNLIGKRDDSSDISKTKSDSSDSYEDKRNVSSSSSDSKSMKNKSKTGESNNNSNMNGYRYTGENNNNSNLNGYGYNGTNYYGYYNTTGQPQSNVSAFYPQYNQNQVAYPTIYRIKKKKQNKNNQPNVSLNTLDTTLKLNDESSHTLDMKKTAIKKIKSDVDKVDSEYYFEDDNTKGVMKNLIQQVKDIVASSGFSDDPPPSDKKKKKYSDGYDNSYKYSNNYPLSTYYPNYSVPIYTYEYKRTRN